MKTIVCRECGESKRHKGRGLCCLCYGRVRRIEHPKPHIDPTKSKLWDLAFRPSYSYRHLLTAETRERLEALNP